MRWYLLPFLLIFLAACDVPSAAVETNPTLVIATDHLAKEDSLYFAEFGRRNKVTIELKEISADSLMQLFKQDPYGLEIDVVLMHHLYDMRRVWTSKMLEPLKSSFPEEAVVPETKEFIKIGIDPFICVSKENVSINIYDDLSSHPFFMNLGYKSKTQFFAPYEERLHRAKTFERMRALDENKIPMKAWYADSSHAILTSFSEYKMRSPEDTIWNNFTEIQFPNSATSGVFYDFLTIGVVKQSSNFTLASKLLIWMASEQSNKKFVAHRGYEPLRSNGNYRRFATSPVVLMQYHTMMERMFKELQ